MIKIFWLGFHFSVLKLRLDRLKSGKITPEASRATSIMLKKKFFNIDVRLQFSEKVKRSQHWQNGSSIHMFRKLRLKSQETTSSGLRIHFHVLHSTPIHRPWNNDRSFYYDSCWAPTIILHFDLVQQKAREDLQDYLWWNQKHEAFHFMRMYIRHLDSRMPYSNHFLF